MSKMIDKQKLLEKINYYETQYSASASHFDHGIVFLCRNLIASIESGRFDVKEDTASTSLSLFGRFVEKLKPEPKSSQTLWVYCPGCKQDLCSNNSLVKDEDFVYYKCSNCGRESRWDFDTYGPVVVEVDEHGLPKATESNESTQAEGEG